MNIFEDYSSSSSSSEDDDTHPNLLKCTHISTDSNNNNEQQNMIIPSSSPPPPPPTDLQSNDQTIQNRKRLKMSQFALPPVIPHQPKHDSYLVHVFLPIETQIMNRLSNSLMSQTRLRMISQPIKASFNQLSTYHVSISRPVTIKYADIPFLVDSLRNNIQSNPNFEIQIHNCVAGFLNKSLRRMFIAAPVTCTSTPNVLSNLIKVVDTVFEQRGLQPFFKDSKPHISFAWTDTTDVYPLYKQYHTLTNINSSNNINVQIQKVVCTIGKSSYYFTLT